MPWGINAAEFMLKTSYIVGWVDPGKPNKIPDHIGLHLLYFY
jgi:hypothetical protein